jgi:hypothetical protein
MDASARQLRAVCQRSACQCLWVHIRAAEDAAKTFLSVTCEHDALVSVRSLARTELVSDRTVPSTRGGRSGAAPR